MKTKVLNEERLKRYLLDEMSDEECETLEIQFLEDDHFFDELVALEDELYFDYQQNRLNLKERKAFEKKFLQTQKEHEKSEFAEAFLQATSELVEKKNENSGTIPTVSLWQSIVAFFDFSGSFMQYGMSAAVVLLLLGGGWLFYQNLQIRNELAKQQQNQVQEKSKQEQLIADKQRQQEILEQQLAQERMQKEENGQRIQEIETERNKLEQEIAEARRRVNEIRQSPVPQKTQVSQPQPSFATLILSPGLFTRSDGQPMNQIKLAASVKNLQIRLLLKNPDEYKNYRAQLNNIDAGQLWTSAPLKASGNGAKRIISLTIPAQILKRADYELTLSGFTQDNSTEEITKYYFSILK